MRRLSRMRRTTLAIALATGALAIPAYALASGDGTLPTRQDPTTTPVQQQEQPQQRDHDCPEPGGDGGSTDTGATQL
jgi:hypothetical protein